MTGNEKSIVENTLLQIKAVEDAISENAKGILASTMKEEISELVRESLGGSKKSKRSLHEEEEGMDTPGVEDDELEGSEDEMEYDTEMDDETEMDMDDETEMDMDDETEPAVDNEEMPPLDMTQSPMSDVLKVFKAMGDEDGIIVKKDGKFLHITDNETNKDYMVQLEESKIRRKMKSRLNEEILYELHFEDKETYSDYEGHDEGDYGFEGEKESDDVFYELNMNELEDFEKEDEGVYEGWEDGDEYGDPEMYEQDEDGDEYGDPEMYEQDEDGDEYGDPEMYEQEDDNNHPTKMYETFKPKGRVGKMKFKYPSKLKRGVAETAFDKEEMDEEWKEEMDEELMSPEDGEETAEKSEAARTYGNGSKYGRGLRKGITPNRDYVYGKNGVQKESVNRELNVLREKNEEYKKALDFFRNKLNEVAVFNSNLAYSTRLFTENSTTKQEKINILRRFDNVESLKESKNLYKTIKNELDGNGSATVVKESITERVVKTPQTGSATNLIESKTYENPQFMRMKDLMAKIK
jgi:hypothetical protein